MPVDSEVTGIGLHMAARDGNAKMVQAVLARKSPLVNIEERDLLGDTALLKAARYGHLEVVNIMAKAGADLRVQDNKGWGCLHNCISNNHKNVFLALLSRNRGPPVDIEAKTLTHDTPLHMAAYHNREWAVDALLRLGGDALASARNNDGTLPHQVARHGNMRDLLRLAVRHTKADTPSSEGPGADSDGDGRLSSSDKNNCRNLNNSEQEGDRGDNLGERFGGDSFPGNSEWRVDFGYDEPTRRQRGHERTARLNDDGSTSSSCGSPRYGASTRDVDDDKCEELFEEDPSDNYETE